MIEYPILTYVIFMPLFGAIFILFLPSYKNSEVLANLSKKIAFFISIITNILSFYILAKFDSNDPGFQFEETTFWIDNFNINYHLGIDGISVYFLVLTTILTTICLISSFRSIKDRVREYMVAFLVLESFVLGVFCALDFVIFYIFFEAMLIPMYLIIGIWGGENRVYAAYKFFLYTLAGSLFLLLAIIYIYDIAGTTDIVILADIVPKIGLHTQKILWLAMFLSFAVKVPMWPFHTWLPDAHVQAPTAGSVILAGILLKMGAYGFLRFSLPLLPDASQYFANYVFILSSIAVIYASFVALAQTDLKKLIAYSSIAHMGYVTIGIFSFNIQAIEGAIIQMISHGIIASALFLCVGVLYDRLHTKEIILYGGVAQRMPRFAFIFMIFTMASIGLPGTSGFVGELLILAGTYKVNKLFAALCTTGVVLGSVYMLWLYKRVMFGELKINIEKFKDISSREKAMFLPLIALTIFLGIYPVFLTDDLHVSVVKLINQVVAVGELN